MRLPGRSVPNRVKRLLQRVLTRLAGTRVRSVQFSTDKEFLQLIDFPSASGTVGDVLRHYEGRVGSEWPGVPDSLTDLRLDLAQMTDDEIIRRADDALDGDLHSSGLKPKLTDTGGLDWKSNPSSSREWLHKLHRHGWWPLWAAAYERTGDEKYAQAFVMQLVDWIDKNPIPSQKSERLFGWRLMEVGLRIRISWIPAFACFYQSAAFSDAAKMKMLRAIYDHGRFLNKFYTNRNHLLRESNGLLAIALCFPEFEESKGWGGEAVRRLEQELAQQINSDGSHIEMSVGYQWLTVDEFEVTRSLLNHFRCESTTSTLDGTVRKMYEYLAAIIRPDRTFPQLNDGFILWGAERLASVARREGWATIEYAATTGGSGIEPDYCSRWFPNAGLHVMRSDWSDDARYMIVDTGPYGGPHGHEDKLSFELAAYGANFIVDPGSYTYNKTDPYREYFVGSAGHNTVLVDHQSQARRHYREHMQPAVRDDQHGYWLSNSDFDHASGRYEEGYAPFSINPRAGTTIDTDVAHQRDFVFVKPDYWVVVDYLSGAELHEFTFLFHLAPDVVVESLGGASALLRSTENGAQLVLTAITEHDITGEIISGQESPIQGWYSEDHYKKCPSPVLSFRISSTRSAFVTWVLYPLQQGADPELVQVEASRDHGTCRSTIEVRYGDALDQVEISHKIDARPDSAPNMAAGIIIRRQKHS